MRPRASDNVIKHAPHAPSRGKLYLLRWSHIADRLGFAGWAADAGGFSRIFLIFLALGVLQSFGRALADMGWAALRLPMRIPCFRENPQ